MYLFLKNYDFWQKFWIVKIRLLKSFWKFWKLRIENYSYSEVPPPKGPTRGSGEPSEERTWASAHKLRTDTTAAQSTAKKRVQGGWMSTQILRIDATDGVKKYRTPASGKNKSTDCFYVCKFIYEFFCFTRNFDQNVYPVKGG